MEGYGSGEGYRPPDHVGIDEAAQYMDRAAIEAQAWELIANRESIDIIAAARQERCDNARTALWEGLTKSGHLSRIEIHGTLEEINAQVLNRLLRGYSDKLPAHEQRRRFQELCEELVIQRTHHAIAIGDLPPSTAVAIISDFPETIPVKSARNLGYRPDNKKGMVRSTHLVQHPNGSCTRIIEQMSRSNGTGHSTQGFLAAAGIRPPHRGSSDLTALATPVLYSIENYTNGVVDLQRHLDYHAGPNIRYGEAIGTNPLHVDYDQVRHESGIRERQAEGFLNDIADYAQYLDNLVADGAISRQQRDSQYNKKLLHTLRVICSMAPEYAADCFGQKAAAYYHEASEAVLRGDFELAQRIIDDAREHEEVVIICGASLSDKEEEELGLGLNDLARSLKDGKEIWGWKQGVCRVLSCRTRPQKTDVGPCSVCRSCQRKFDKGDDPTKVRATAPSVVSIMQSKNAEPIAA
jgi:hypothetical protein